MNFIKLTVAILALLAFNACSKNNEVALEIENEISYINSKSFRKVAANFSIDQSNLKIDQSFDVASGDEDVEILIIPVYVNDIHSAYLWTYLNKSKKSYTTFYEELNFDHSVLTSASLFSENKIQMLDLDFEKLDSGLRYVIADEPVEYGNTINRAAESYTDCVTRVYQAAKDACEADATCDTLCDFTPGCHTSMLAAAAVSCINFSDEPSN